MYYFVIKVAKDVIRAVLLVNRLPTLSLNNDIAQVVMDEGDPNEFNY